MTQMLRSEKITKRIVEKCFVLIGLSMMSLTMAYGQTTITSEDFEDASVNYTTSAAEYSDNAGDFFGRVAPDGITVGSFYQVTGIGGLGYFAAMDLDGDPPNAATQTMSFENLNINSIENLNISLKIAEDDDGANQDWDADAFFFIEVSFDSGPYSKIFQVASGGATNTEPGIDTDLDGVQDGTAITSSFAQFDIPIVGTGSILDVRFTFAQLEAGDEDIAIDDIVITGTEIGSITKLLISEVAVTPTAGEFIEIYNPGGSPVDLENYYLTDAVFTGSPSTFYYNIVTGVNAGGGSFGDFHAKFPAGSSIGAGEYLTVSLAGSGDFFSTYGVDPYFELYEDGVSSDGIIDLEEAFAGSVNDQGGLSNGGEIVVLYYWDGATDLVTDIDYILWGDGAEAVDKSNVNIDGPDGDSDNSTYSNETATGSQAVVSTSAHSDGDSYQRTDLSGGNQTPTGGNGVNGRDETSEDLDQTFAVLTVTPGEAVPEDPAIIRIISVNTDQDEIILKNLGVAEQDVSSYAICLGPGQYETLSDYSSIEGDLSLGANEEVTIVLSSGTSITDLTGTEGLGLFSVSGDFGSTDPAIFLDYLQWGAANQDRSPQAVTAGRWDDANLFISGNSPYSYTGGIDDVGSTFWESFELTDIGVARGQDAQQVNIQGIVTSNDFGFGNGEYYVQDATGGIKAFHPSSFGLVEAGDEVALSGTIGTNAGQIQITVSSVMINSSNNPLPAAVVISGTQVGDAEFQGERVTINNVSLTNESQWPVSPNTTSSGTNVDASADATNFVIRIDRGESEFDGSFVPESPFTITGILGNFNSTQQVWPFFQGDVPQPLVVVEEDFETNPFERVVAAWSEFDGEGSLSWGYNPDGQSADLNAFGDGCSSDDWLISPEINLAGLSDVSLSIGASHVFDGNDLFVYISDNYDPGVDPDPNNATLTQIGTIEHVPGTGSSGTNVSFTGAIPEGFNGLARLFIEYENTDCAGWSVGNVSIIAGSVDGAVLGFTDGEFSAREGVDATINLELEVLNAASIPAGGDQVTVTLLSEVSGPADQIDNFASQLVNLVQGVGTYSVSITIPDDMATEARANYVFELSGTNEVIIGTLNQTALVLSDDDIPLVTISSVQGAAQTSPKEGEDVQVSGIVTAIDGNGFYIQSKEVDDDADPFTSEAIFISSDAGVSVGDEVSVIGVVEEFSTSDLELTRTQLSGSPLVTVMSSGNALPTPVIIGQNGRTPPTEFIDLDPFSYDPTEDGADFWESLEGMRATIDNPMVVSPTNFDFYVVADNGANATGISSRNTIKLGEDDWNPEKILIDNDNDIFNTSLPAVNPGALLADLTGIITYETQFNDAYQLTLTEAVVVNTPSTLMPSTASPAIAKDVDRLLVASYNLLNIDPNDAQSKYDAIAGHIVNDLNAPDIIGLQEVQDNSGATNDGTTAADVTLQRLVDAIEALDPGTEFDYAFIDNTFITDGESGGQPGGNIRTAFLYNQSRAGLVPASVQTISSQDPGAAFEGARLPIVADFTFNNEVITVINNHFSSKGGSAPVYGQNQPFTQRQDDEETNGSVDERLRQSLAVQAFIDDLLLDPTNPNPNIILTGDLNEFEFVAPVTGIAERLNNLTDLIPRNERYTFIFQGNAQQLDHILVSSSLLDGAEFEIVHVNIDFPETGDDDTQPSDHDPLVASILVEEPVAGPFTLQLLHYADVDGNEAVALDALDEFSALLDGFQNDSELKNNTLTVTSGDILIPGPRYNIAEQTRIRNQTGSDEGGHLDILFANAFGVQAATIGNHELDLGPANFWDAALRPESRNGVLFPGSQFPWLSANIDFSQHSDFVNNGSIAADGENVAALTAKAAKSAVAIVNGERIGIVGAASPTFPTITSTSDVSEGPLSFTPGINFTNEELAAVIQPAIDALEADGIDKIVLLAHMQQIAVEKDLAELLNGVDIIVAGGSNTRMGNDAASDTYSSDLIADEGFDEAYPYSTTNADGDPVLVVNTDGDYKYVGRLVVDFNLNGVIDLGSISPSESSSFASISANVSTFGGEPIEEAVYFRDEIQDILSTQKANIFGYSSVYLDGRRGSVRTQETNLGNLTADANLWYANELDEVSVDISIKNGGGIRAEIGTSVIPPGAVDESETEFFAPENGAVSEFDLRSTMRFNNDLVRLTVTGFELKDILEHGLAGTAPGNTPGQFPQVGGMTFSFDPSGTARTTSGTGTRIVRVVVNRGDDDPSNDVVVVDGGVVVEPNMTFNLVTLDFLAGGGDDYPFPGLSAPNRVDYDSEAFAASDPGLNDISDHGAEQDALAEFMAEFHTEDTPFAKAETSPEGDNRIINIQLDRSFTLQLLHYADADGNESTALGAVDELSGIVDAFQNDDVYGENSLLVTSGDIIIPGPRFFAAEQSPVRAVTGSNEPGHVDIAFANAMGVAASTVGNHELDAGPGEFFDAAFKAESSGDASFPGSEFPWLAANIDYSEDEDFAGIIGDDGADVSGLKSKVAKHAVVIVNGQRIGLVGASTPTLPNITTTGQLIVTPGTDFTNEQLAAEIQPSVDALRDAGVDKIILLAHMQQISVEKALAELLDGVDIIVAGGSNTRMGNPGNTLFEGDPGFDEAYPFSTTDATGDPVLVVNVDGDYKYLGRLVVEFDENGNIIPGSINPTVSGAYASTTDNVNALGGTPNPTVIEVRDAVQGVIDEQFSNVVGFTNVYLDGRRSQVRTQETNLGNLTADANLWYANLLNTEMADPVSVSIKNGGGIRTEIGSAVLPSGSTDPNDIVFSPPANGQVSEGDLKAVLRFDNGLVRLTSTAEELVGIIEHALAGTAPGATPGQFPQISGLEVQFDPQKSPGNRIVYLEVNGPDGNGPDGNGPDVIFDNGMIQGDANRTFNLVTLNFLANGGDDYPFPDLSNANRVNYYTGTGFGEDTDFPDGFLANDPDLNDSDNGGFSYTGGEQDALAEYMLAFYPDTAPYDEAETPDDLDTRIFNVRTDGTFTLQLLHYADADGNEEIALDAIDELSGLVDAFKNKSVNGPTSLLVTSGDIIIPGPRFFAAEQSEVRSITGSNEPGHVDIAFANAMGVAASAVGNHELDAGPGEFFDAAFASESSGDAVFPGSEFPWLAANIDFSGDGDFQDVIGMDGAKTDDLQSKVAKYAVTMVNGERIGLIGASTPTLPNITSTGSLVVTPGINFTNEQLAAEIQPAIDALEADGVNKIVLLAHMQQISVEKSLAELLDGVDIIVAGGSNTRMGNPGNTLFEGDDDFDEPYPFSTTDAAGDPVVVVNVDGDYKYLGRLVADFDPNGVLIPGSIDPMVSGAYASDPMLVSNLEGTPNPTVIEVRNAVQNVIEAQFGNVIGYTGVYLDGRRSQVRTQETNLGNLTADANLWYANLLNPEGDAPVDVAIKNGGGIRTEVGSAVLPPGSVDPEEAEFLPPPNGEVSEGNLKAVLRFDNGLVRLTATASELKDIMEHAVSATAPGATPGQFPQIAGMQIVFDPAETPRSEPGTGNRIRRLVVNKPGGMDDVVVDNGVIQGDPNRPFNLVTLNFLANGGDSYPFPGLSDSRINYYSGTGFGDPMDFPDGNLLADPENNTTFSYTGGEQDALAEFMLEFHPVETPFGNAETGLVGDNRIINNSVERSFTLQLLHYADVDGNETTALNSVDEFSAIVDVFQNDELYGDQSLLVTSGDIIIPGPRFFAAEQSPVRAVTGSNEPGHVDIAFANAMGVAASAVGNHELDAGPGEFFDAAFKAESSGDASFPGSEFPWLASNIDFSGDEDFAEVIGADGSDVSTLQSKVAKHAVVLVDGQPIGLVGASTPTLPNITSTGSLDVKPGPIFTNEQLAAEIQPSIDALQAAGVNKIILLAHMQQIAVEKALAELLDGVDIIVAGGSNTRMGNPGNALFDGDGSFDEEYPFATTDASGDPVMVVNVDGDYKYLGRLVVEFDENGNINPESIDPSISGAYASTAGNVTALGGTPNATVVEVRDAVQGVIDEQFSNVVGYTSVYLDGRRSQVRTEETNLGNLTADANLWYANTLNPAMDDKVLISLKNGGGIRTEIGSAVLPSGSTNPDDIVFSPPTEGKVTEGDLRAVLRFDNGLVRLTVTATELKDILEHAVSATAPGATPGQFPQIGGLTITYDPFKAPRLTNEMGVVTQQGERILRLEIIDPDGPDDLVVDNGVIQGDANRTFNLVTLNFLANGGDNYPFPDLSNPGRLNYYSGTGFGEDTDFPDGNLAADPNLNDNTMDGFSYTGGEQDALAEYMLAFYPIGTPFDMAETPANEDGRIMEAQTVVRLDPPAPTFEDVLPIEVVSSFQAPGVAFDESAAEIPAYDLIRSQLFFTDANSDEVHVYDMSNPLDPTFTTTITLQGAPNSVAVYGDIVAVATEADPKQDPGSVEFFSAVTHDPIGIVTVGVLPDMVTFNEDGTKVLTANEGEPSDDYLVDPEGSISIVTLDLANLSNSLVETATFTAFNDGVDEDIRIFGRSSKGTGDAADDFATTVAQDLEPEYITVSGNTAYVTLQENNALAIVDISSATVTDLVPLGFKDHFVPGNGIDASDREDDITIAQWPVYGMYMPDAIASYEVDGQVFLITANEGDAREYEYEDLGGDILAFAEEERVKDLTLDPGAFPNAAFLQGDNEMGRLTVTTINGDTDGDGDFDELYAFGTRSFTIWNGTTGEVVWDSKNALEQLTAQRNPDYFNATNDENNFDNRSDNKGPEPEGVIIGEVNGKPHAFVGLERVGGIVAYDISNPAAPKFVSYINNRDFSVEFTGPDGVPTETELADVGDLGPEGLAFVPADQSPTNTALLIVTNEVSGTVTTFQVGDPLPITDNVDPVAPPFVDNLAFELKGSFTVPGEVFDESAAEIPAYDVARNQIFFTDANSDVVHVLDNSDINNPTLTNTINLGGAPNSVAVFGDLVAVAVEADPKQDPGSVEFYSAISPYNKLGEVQVGALPDMLTFNEDGTKVLTANEGEPSDDYSNDPEGSVSIITLDMDDLSSSTVETAGFSAFNSDVATLRDAGVRIFGRSNRGFGDKADGMTATVAQDLEPEFITVSGNTAYVTLQENNALAIVNINTATVTSIVPLGTQDHSMPGNGIDASDKDDKINIAQWPVFGMYMPDAIASYQVEGETYLITANEGDAREYEYENMMEEDVLAFAEEERVKDLDLDPQAFLKAAALQQNEALGRLTVTTVDGDTDGDGDYDELYTFGTRSFTIWNDAGAVVWDSKNALEQITAQRFPQFFNATNDENNFDNRSDNKGPEPEGVIVGEVNGRPYAFVGLERVGGIVAYDISNPAAPVFAAYKNNRDFSVEFDVDDEGDPEPSAAQLDAVGDLAPEGLAFVKAEQSPTRTALLIVTNEVSGTVSVYEVGQALPPPNVAPVVANAVTNQTAVVGFTPIVISLAEVFTDANGEALSLAAVSSNAELATVAIVDNQLTITGVGGTGTVTISLTATDGAGETATTSFDLVISPVPTFSLTVTVTDPEGAAIADATTTLFRKVASEFEQVSQATISSTTGNTVAFSALSSGDYVVAVNPGSTIASQFFRTYSGNQRTLNEATVTSLNADASIAIALRAKPVQQGNGGNGVVSGKLNNPNASGRQEQTALAGVDVFLLDSDGEVVGFDTTDSNGEFSFTGLLPGDYTLSVDYEGLPIEGAAVTVGSDTSQPVQLELEVTETGIVSRVVEVTGVDDELIGELLIYPNPVQSDLTIQHGSLSISRVDVISTNGQVVREFTFNGKSSIEIDLTDLNSGIYIIQIVDDVQNITIMERIVKN